MAKTAGRLLRLVFALLIVSAVGYNFRQTALLRAEVERLKRASRGAEAAEGGGAAAAGAGASLFDEARRHAEQAQEFLRTKQYAPAQRELQRATRALDRASRSARDAGSGGLAGLRETLRTLSEQADRLWGQQTTPRNESEKNR
jgi:hypothetical protein